MKRLVLLHGMLGSGESFASLRATLADVPTHAPTLFGHGPRPSPVPRSFEEAADTLAAELTTTSDEPIALLGYSFGARLALALCARHPRLVHRALLVSVHPGLTDEAERRARREDDAQWAALAETGEMRALVDAWEARPIFATQHALDPETRAAQRAIRLAHDPRAIAACFRRLGLGSMPDLRHALATPLIELVVGDADTKFAALARTLPVTTHVVAGAGHNPVLESPHALAALARAIAAHERRTS